MGGDIPYQWYTTRGIVNFLAAFGLYGSIILPYVQIGSVGLYLTTLLSPIIFFIFLEDLLRNKKMLLASLTILIGFISFWVIASSMISWIRLISDTSSRDIMESIKYLQYIPYLLVLHLLDGRFLRIESVLCKVAICIVLFIGIVQIFNVPILNKSFSTLYLGPSSVHYDGVLTGERLTLSGSDPNSGAIICCFLLLYAIIRFQNLMSFRWLALSGMLLFFLLTTQSRTVLLACVVSVSVFFVFFSTMKLFGKIILFSVFFAMAYFLFISLDLSYIVLGFEMALEGQNNSLNVRFENIKIAYEYFQFSPIFGIGPAKMLTTTNIDSEIALVMQRYGAVGLFLFGSLTFYLLRFSKRNMRFLVGKVFFMFMLMVPFIMLTNNIYSGYQVMSIPVLLYISVYISCRQFSCEKK